MAPVGEIGGTTLSGRLTFGGLATGLDTNALIQTLLAIEARPLARMQAQRADVEETQELFRELNSKLLTLRNAARDIDNRVSTLGGNSVDEELMEFAATSTDDTVLTASATGDAVPQTYSITVTQLASVGRELSTGQADPDTDLGYGSETLEIDYGDPTSLITVDVNGLSLKGIASAINNHANNDGNVTASVLYDGTDYHLVVSGTQSGEDNDVEITESAGIAGFIDAGLEQAAADSIINVLGIDIQRDSNTIEDAIEGVTLNLHDAGGPIELEIATDVEAIAENLEALTNAYNDVRDFIAEHTAFDEETNTSGLLAGDSTVRFIDGLIQTTLIDSFTFTDSSAFQGLSEIGISTGSNGRLSVDREKLEEALASDSGAVKKLLGGDASLDEDGAAVALAKALDPIVRIGDGVMTTRDQGFDTRLETIDSRIDRFTRFLEIREERLIERYARLESSIAALQAQEGFLAAI